MGTDLLNPCFGWSAAMAFLHANAQAPLLRLEGRRYVVASAEVLRMRGKSLPWAPTIVHRCAVIKHIRLVSIYCEDIVRSVPTSQIVRFDMSERYADRLLGAEVFFKSLVLHLSLDFSTVQVEVGCVSVAGL